MVSVAGIQKLTHRQKEILRLLLSGYDAKSAASQLRISVHTVNEHLGEARRHLQVSSSREAARIFGQAESAPPKIVGPETLGVVHRTVRRFPFGRSSANGWLAYPGVTLVLVTVAMIALAIADEGLKPASSGISAAAQQQNTEKRGPGSYQSHDVTVGAFERIEVTGPFKVGVIVGQKPPETGRVKPAPIQMVGPPKMLADVIARVEAGALMIRFREGASWGRDPGAGVNIIVFAPQLVSARADRAAQVKIGSVRGDTFSASTDGSSAIAVDQMQVRRATFATGGSGGITAEGSAHDVSYVVGGPGTIDAKRLKAETASISNGGAGSVYADVSRTANVSVTGAGRVEIVGGAQCLKQPRNSARIECR
jgi:DNA-binding CsgD family transcriptional regulator